MDVDAVIFNVLNSGMKSCELTQKINENLLMALIELCRQVLGSQGMFIEVRPPVKICGDIHGQYADLLRIFDRGGFPPLSNYLFLGDYVDRGQQSLEVITLFIAYKLKNFDQLRNLGKYINPPNPNIITDLLWADPDLGTEGFEESTRGVSYTFGEDVVMEAVKRLDIDLVARAHQVVQDGYEFFANRRMVTIFSAPHYCGQFDNAAAFMQVNESLVCSFQILRPQHKQLGTGKS
ncbi:hypothetical protein WR25_12026 [Diploscapter pachys]|uniref:Serine/threonine specific protein phosphatases domain-containing protein n=1 Tax=Diploscapter pachys TaxID=2018661 RepID=A0A2A2KCQ8_9BILA|nr:hypothetical protein WR25_12026 [Diploscapter pachys]